MVATIATLSVSEARTLLDKCERHELRDRAFGDSEFTFIDEDGEIIAEGYRGQGSISIEVNGNVFDDGEANSLLKAGKPGTVEMNDSMDDELDDNDDYDYNQDDDEDIGLDDFDEIEDVDVEMEDEEEEED